MIDSCLTGETKVLGPHGTKRMDELESGDLVYSYNDGGLESRQVRNAWFTRRQEVFKVRTSNRTLLASANHPFLRLRCIKRTQERDQTGRFASDEWVAEWARVDDLRRGDRIVTMRHAPDAGSLQKLSDGTPITEEVAWLLGLIAGDGWISPSGVAICVYGETREKAARICKAVWGANNSRHETTGIRVHSARLRDTLRNLEELTQPSYRKRVPKVVWLSPDRQKRAFLDGYGAADGYEGKHGRTYTSTSQDLISEVRMMHVALGDRVANLTITSNQPPVRIRGKLVTNRRPYWCFEAFRRQSRGLDDGQVPLALRRFLNGAFAYQQVLSVQSAGEQDTYDLEVEGSHNFVAEGMVVYNSHSMNGEPMEWASAVALALAHAAGGKAGSGSRSVYMIFFNAQIVREIEIAPGEKDVKKLLEIGTVDAAGGTEYVPPISRALDILAGNAGNKSNANADLLLVTDGLCQLPEEFAARLGREKTALGFKLACVLVGSASREGEIGAFSDPMIRASDLARASGARDAAAQVFENL